MRICHNLPFLYVLICFAFNVFYIKIRHYSYNLVLLDKGRFVLLSGRSGIRIPSGVPHKSPAVITAGLFFINAFRLNLNPWFYQGWVRKALANKNPHVTLVKVWRPHHEAETRRFLTMKNEVKHTAHSSYRC